MSPVAVPLSPLNWSPVADSHCLPSPDLSSDISSLSPLTRSLQWPFRAVSPHLISPVGVPYCLPHTISPVAVPYFLLSTNLYSGRFAVYPQLNTPRAIPSCLPSPDLSIGHSVVSLHLVFECPFRAVPSPDHSVRSPPKPYVSSYRSVLFPSPDLFSGRSVLSPLS